jgi:hypothetical protein
MAGGGHTSEVSNPDLYKLFYPESQLLFGARLAAGMKDVLRCANSHYALDGGMRHCEVQAAAP